MIPNGKELLDFIDSILKKEGFTKKKDTWYKSSEDCICFFTIGKSPYGGYYENVLGCFLKELNDTNAAFPIYYKCDVKFSMELLADQELVKRVLDLENNEFKGEEREFILKELLELYVIPFLQHISSKEGIKLAVKKYDGLIYYIKFEARKLLSIKMPKESKTFSTSGCVYSQDKIIKYPPGFQWDCPT